MLHCVARGSRVGGLHHAAGSRAGRPSRAELRHPRVWLHRFGELPVAGACPDPGVAVSRERIGRDDARTSPGMAKAKITERVIDTLRTASRRTGKSAFLWDTELRGFGLRV